MIIKASTESAARFEGDMVVYFVRRQKKKVAGCGDRSVDRMIGRAVASGDFEGKEGQTLLFYPPAVKKGKRLLIVGLGKEEPSRETLRKAGGTAVSETLKTKARKALAILPDATGLDAGEVAECLTEGLLLGAYRFKKYKTQKDPDEQEPSLREITLSPVSSAAARHGVKQGKNAAEAGCVARDMANEPGNHWTPSHFAAFARQVAKKSGFKATVLSLAMMKRLGMGGILGVNQGSAQPPKLVILEYHADKKAPTLLLVGKGLTFDSGGISLKPGPGMEEMKYDMCGAASVLAAMQAVGREKPKKLNLVAMVPATENLPGPSALKPGDVITMYGGKTVEVINTDAEGRLILADALAYGIEKYKPAALIDLATLTGAVIIGLGHHRTGLLANDDDLCAKIFAAGDRAGEPLWRLPLGPEYSKQLKSTIADLKNVHKRDAGTILGAAFLQEFVGDIPWAHLDIAGTAWNFTEKPYVPKGPSGIGARTLIELIRNWK